MKKFKIIDKQLYGFKTYLVEKAFSENSIRTYLNGVRIFLQGNPGADAYRYEDILSYLEYKPYRQLSLNARKGYLIQIKKYYDYLIETNQRQDHPCKTLNLKGNTKRGIIHTDLFSSAELESLLERESGYDKLVLRQQAIVSLFIYQAPMPYEIANLKLHHIDLDAGTVYLHGGRVLTARKLELHIKQVRLFDRYIHEARKKLLLKNNSDKLFINFQGNPDTQESVSYPIETQKYRFPGRRLTTKTVRDSVISYWLNERKLPLEQVQLMAGHRWISCTERYLQASIDEQREVLRKAHPLG